MRGLALAALLLTGCAGVQQALNPPDTRPPEVQRIEIASSKAPDDLFDAVRLALARDGFGIEAAERDAGLIRTLPIEDPPRSIWVTVSILPDSTGSAIFVSARGRYESSVTTVLNGDYDVTSRGSHWHVVEKAAAAIRTVAQP